MNHLPQHLVIFDSVCGLCDRTIQFLLKHDHQKRLFFTPLQGVTAQEILERHPHLREIDSMIYVENRDGNQRVWTRSKAVFRAVHYLQSPWSMISVLGAMPSFITDAGYDLVAKNRYHIFGRLEQCRIPSPEEKERFLP